MATQYSLTCINNSSQFSVGVGQSGSAAYLVQAAQNITTVFKPRPNYWGAFGHFQPGQVLDLEEITGVVEVPYPDSVTSHTATLGANNIITVA